MSTATQTAQRVRAQMKNTGLNYIKMPCRAVWAWFMSKGFLKTSSEKVPASSIAVISAKKKIPPDLSLRSPRRQGTRPLPRLAVAALECGFPVGSSPSSGAGSRRLKPSFATRMRPSTYKVRVRG